MILRYQDPISANTQATYQALIATVTSESGADATPWQLALDVYRAWLDTKMQPVQYPDWMWNGQGMLNVQLENYTTSKLSSIKNTWQSMSTLYPWVLFWGQMDSYAGGCCGLKQVIDSRLQPDFIEFVRSITATDQYRAGYYSAPYYGTSTSNPKELLDTQSGLDWLITWLATNQEYGANSYYIDTLATLYYGNPATMMGLFASGDIPKDALLEGVVDMYPAAGLVSGMLVGNSYLCGAPWKTPENSAMTTFPRFGRYLLGDRLMYSGESNWDFTFWGTGAWSQSDSLNQVCDYVAYCSSNGPCEHWTETQSFLLGTKLDVMAYNPVPGANSVLDAINQARQRVNWWGRQPVYLDTKGLDLTAVPLNSRIEVRRFRDKNGVQLMAISNPNLVPGCSFGFNGKEISIPTQAVAVIEVF
jgi:hypothetical protein